mmetsp:Transcript_15013/g.45980  ORF Transcript_15013/g.45980 Transcript_15013/m.45980 type:complete len:205 (+) Transcript_15013:843-1457(+)
MTRPAPSSGADGSQGPHAAGEPCTATRLEPSGARKLTVATSMHTCGWRPHAPCTGGAAVSWCTRTCRTSHARLTKSAPGLSRPTWRALCRRSLHRWKEAASKITPTAAHARAHATPARAAAGLVSTRRFPPPAPPPPAPPAADSPPAAPVSAAPCGPDGARSVGGGGGACCRARSRGTCCMGRVTAAIRATVATAARQPARRHA